MKHYFLLIGAMKAGTSSLHHDLSSLDGVFMTPEKEPNDLASELVLSDEGKTRYLNKFKAANPGDICGDASTSYSKMPTHPNVPTRAVNVLGRHLKVIYVMRDPIDRIISHYKHLIMLGLENRPLNEAVLEDSTYVDYSDYDYQLSFWREVLPESQILVLQFEDYIEAPQKVLESIAAFLGVAPPQNVMITHRNSSTDRSFVPRDTFLFRLLSSPFFQYRLKPFLGRAAVDQLKRLMLPRATASDEVLSDETKAALVQRLHCRRLTEN